MIDLEERLKQGPLRVQSLWRPDRTSQFSQRLLIRRRVLAVSLAAAVAAVAAVAAAAFPFFGRRHTQVASTTSVASSTSVGSVGSLGSIAATSAPPAAVEPSAFLFSDGSRAELYAAGTTIQLTEDTPARVVAKLAGGARFDVVHRPTRVFEVTAGVVTARVLGTTFAMRELGDRQSEVSVERGLVQVVWPGGATVLQDGQGGLFPPATVSREPPPAVQSLPVEGKTGMSPHRALERRPWREHALSGDYGRAYDELHAESRADLRDDPDDLMLVADVARLSGHSEQAISPLRRLCARYPHDKRAHVAAFTLGRVLLDDLSRARDAAQAFVMARRVWPSGPLTEDALAREAEAWQRAGEPTLAREAAGQYLARAPQGAKAAIMRTLRTP